MIKLLYLFLFLLISCESITQLIEGDDYFKAIDNKSNKKQLSLIFSHNINGELEPCGCRHHPLGGLSQVGGFFTKNSGDAVNFYVDTGDTFFPSPVIPKTLSKSLTFSAHKIAEAFDMLGLKYFLPGDQDFAGGLSFLKEVSMKYKFSFLISNLKKDVKLKHQKVGLHSFGEQEFVFLGLVDPSLMNNYGNLFNNPNEALERIFSEHPDYRQKTVIILSHLGMQADQVLAKKYPFIKWIIGSHSQSFLQDPITVEKTSIVQVLSRNHYLGMINFKPSKQTTPKYELVEMRQHWAKEILNNPFIDLIEKHRTDVRQIQEDEQMLLLNAQGDKTVYKKPTATSCISCHKNQANHWQKTAHALAYQTLRQVKADANPKCVGCHSLGYQKETGFVTTQNIVQFRETDQKKKDIIRKKYFQELDKTFKSISSIRELSNGQRAKITKKWLKLDEKHQVTHNFSNVQCLNCHDQNIDHPFEEIDPTKKKSVNTNKCLSCHTSDQSPAWYSKGHKPVLDKTVLQKMIKKISCPKRKTE